MKKYSIIAHSLGTAIGVAGLFQSSELNASPKISNVRSFNTKLPPNKQEVVSLLNNNALHVYNISKESNLYTSELYSDNGSVRIKSGYVTKFVGSYDVVENKVCIENSKVRTCRYLYKNGKSYFFEDDNGNQTQIVVVRK